MNKLQNIYKLLCACEPKSLQWSTFDCLQYVSGITEQEIFVWEHSKYSQGKICLLSFHIHPQTSAGISRFMITILLHRLRGQNHLSWQSPRDPKNRKVSSQWYAIVKLVCYRRIVAPSSNWCTILTLVHYRHIGALSSHWCTIVTLVCYVLRRNGALSSYWCPIVVLVDYRRIGANLLDPIDCGL